MRKSLVLRAGSAEMARVMSCVDAFESRSMLRILTTSAGIDGQISLSLARSARMLSTKDRAMGSRLDDPLPEPMMTVEAIPPMRIHVRRSERGYRPTHAKH